MPSIELNNFNTAFKLEGNKDRTGVEVIKVDVLEWPMAGNGLNLEMVDEKDITINNQQLNMPTEKASKTFEINKYFAFYDHFTIRVSAIGETGNFKVMVYFK